MNTAQREVIDHYKAFNVPAEWFEVPVPPVLPGGPEGSVEVLAFGDTFVWSFLIDATGDYDAKEAPLVAPGEGTVMTLALDPANPTATRTVEIGDWGGIEV